MRRLTCALAAAALLSAAPATAAPPDERAAVLATVQTLLDSWRGAQPDKGEAVLHPEFRLVTLQGEGAERKVNLDTRAHLLESMHHIRSPGWDDRLIAPEVRIDPHGLANVWSRYAFYFDGVLHHCGYVSFELYRTGDGWKIVNFSDTHNNLDGKPAAEVCP